MSARRAPERPAGIRDRSRRSPREAPPALRLRERAGAASTIPWRPILRRGRFAVKARASERERAPGRHGGLLLLDDAGGVLPEVVRDRLDADLHRPGGLGRIQVLEGEEERARAL